MNERSRSYPRAAAANEFHAKTFESSTETSLNYAIQRALRILPDGTLDAIWPEHRATRSQDLEPAYHDAGQFYWGRTSAFRERREMFSPESTPVILPRELVHDIDTPEDWANAELAFTALRLAEGRRL